MLAVLFALGALGACGDDEYRRPRAEPGKVVTVLDGDTPGVPKESLLTDIAVGTDGVLYAAFRVDKRESSLARPDWSGLILAVPAEGKPFVVADETEHAFPEPVRFLPEALAIDPSSGTLYLMDSASQRIRAIEPGGPRRNVVEFGGRIQGPPSTYLRQPTHLTIDPKSGTLYMADGCQVAQIQGQVNVILGVDSSQCTLDPDDKGPPGSKSPDTGVPATEVVTSSISGLALDLRTGRLVVVDVSGVFTLEADGRLRRLAGRGSRPFLAGEVNRPLEVDMYFDGVAIDPAGTLYLVAPSRQPPEPDLIMRATSDVIEKIAAIKGPRRLALGTDGNLFVGLSQRSSEEPVVRLIALRS